MYFSALWCHQPKNIVTLDSRGHRHWLEAFRETHGCHLQIYPNIHFSNTLTIQVIIKNCFSYWNIASLSECWIAAWLTLAFASLEGGVWGSRSLTPRCVCLSSTRIDGSLGGPSQNESTASQTLLTNDKRKFGFESCFKWLLDNDPNLF